MTKQIHVVDKSYSDASKHLKVLPSENKYRKQDDLTKYKELEEEIREFDKTLKEQDGDPDISPTTPQAKTKGNETDWEKRYSDLRSHMSKKENDWKNSIAHLQTQLDTLSKKNQEPRYPKTEEEVQEWLSKYPDVGAIIQTIAGKTSEERDQKLLREIQVLRAKSNQDDFKSAYNKLLGFHPDFSTIRETADFQDWIAEQTQTMKDHIFSPRLDDIGVKDAASVITLYKVEKGLVGKAKTPEPKQNREAAQSVSRSVSRDPATDDGIKRFSESQVQAMTDREFEKNQEAILEAQRKGHFIYDISGGAR